jgi:hypothetical protein
MEFLPAIGLGLGIYAAFLVLFFRFMRLMHRKEVVMVRRIDKQLSRS